MKNTLKFALTAVLLSVTSVASAELADSVKLSKAVKVAVAADSSKVLEIVAANIAANESCACEIVKAAIVASDADKKLVADIVNTAILAAPSQIRVIAQCAMATAPDAVSNIQAIVERYDSAGGSHSSKGGLADEKGVIDAPDADGPNPLDYPFQSINDPIVKESRWIPEFFYAPIEEDPQVTPVDDVVNEEG
jgi:hypothetical protein